MGVVNIATGEKPPTSTPRVEDDLARLKSQFLVRLCVFVIVVPVTLFVSAGSPKFWQGWAFLAVFFIPNLGFMAYLHKRDPELLRRRMQLKEKLRVQKFFQVAAPLIFLTGFVICGLDLSLRLVTGFTGAGADVGHAACFGLSVGQQFRIMRVNSFAARTIQVEAGQRVVSSGPYGYVRHPMYLGMMVMSLAIPLALGSAVTLPVFFLVVPVLVVRLLNEEKFLRRELAGYSEYCMRTRFRLVPYVW